MSPESETSWCQSESKTVECKRTTVIDTPGFFDTNMSEEERKREIVKCIKECAPGPHAFLIVLQVDRYSPQEEDIIKKICEYFSEEALKHAVIVFTYGDQLDENMKIEEFVSKSKALSDLVKKCGGGCHVFDNKYWNNNPDDYRNNQYQVKQLLNTVDKIKYSSRYYTNEMLQAVSKNKWDTETLLKFLAGVTAGALLGALLGAKTCPCNVVLGSVMGGIAGGVGGAAGYSATTPVEAVKKTIDIAIKFKEATEFFQSGDLKQNPPKNMTNSR